MEFFPGESALSGRACVAQIIRIRVRGRGGVYLQPTEGERRGLRAWGVPSIRYAFISSSGPVLAPIQVDQSGDKNLYDNDQ